MSKKLIETRRKDGSLVGREVSRQRRWEIRNPERHRKMCVAYIKSPKGREKRRGYMRKYNQENKEKVHLMKKIWRENNIEKARKYSRDWYWRNQENQKARAKRYYQNYRNEILYKLKIKRSEVNNK